MLSKKSIENATETDYNKGEIDNYLKCISKFGHYLYKFRNVEKKMEEGIQ